MVGIKSYDEKVEDLFITDFNLSTISEDEFKHFMEVQKIMKFKNLREYNLFYLLMNF